MNQIPRLVTRVGKGSYLACLGLPAVSHTKNVSKSHVINPLLTKIYHLPVLTESEVITGKSQTKDLMY